MADSFIDLEMIFQLEKVSFFTVSETEEKTLLEQNATLILLESPQHQYEDEINNNTEELAIVHILKIGEAQLPLNKWIPVLKSNNFTYLIPFSKNICYAVVLAADTPEPLVNVFEKNMQEICNFRTHQEVQAIVSDYHEFKKMQVVNSSDPTTTALNNVASYVKIGSEKIGAGITKTSEYLAKLISYGGL